MMIVEDHMEDTWKETTVTYFKVSVRLKRLQTRKKSLVTTADLRGKFPSR
jgi:hypothetical protein